ncbi:hypothetical protein DRQ25_18450, partial [Candidatus Fermentibacteria bacterium]
FIELFEVDCTNIPEINTVYYLTPMVDGASKVHFGNNDYDPFPIDIEGIDQSSEGAPARPTVVIANINKLFGSLSFLYEDLVGCTVTYIRTFAIYLDTANKISAPPLKYTISRKVSHTSKGLSWELRSPLDKERAFLPGRQMLKRDFPGLGINKSIR